jgi:hypothetical protein
MAPSLRGPDRCRRSRGTASRSTPRRGWIHLVIAVTLAGGVACSGTAATSQAGPPSASATGVSPATTADPYGPFPYANRTQREAFAAFLECAADEGVELRGPFADSSGNGVLFGPAEGEEISGAEHVRVSKHCPQQIIGLFATPGEGPFDRALFGNALDAFVQCLRTHGLAEFPSPDPHPADPIEALDDLPIEWSEDTFTAAATACIDPLRDYVFAT